MRAQAVWLAVLALYAGVIVAAPWDRLFGAGALSASASLHLAIAFYLLSHLLRVARLALLLVDAGRSFREIASANFAASLATAVIPFRLGELARLAEYTRVCGGRVVPAVSALLTERFFDASVLLAIGVFAAFASDAPAQGHRLLMGLAAGVWALLIVAYLSLPGTLAHLRMTLLVRGRGERSLRWLRVLRVAEDIWIAIRSRVHNRAAALWLVTILVWCAELAAFRAAGGGMQAGELAGAFLAALESGMGVGAPAAGGYSYVVLATLLTVGTLAIAVAIPGWLRLAREKFPPRTRPYVLLEDLPK